MSYAWNADAEQAHIDAMRPVVLGRVITLGNALHFVIDVDPDGRCRVSRRFGGRTEIVVMPIDEVIRHVKAAAVPGC